MTEYAVYKSRNGSSVELYRAPDRDDAVNYFHSKLAGKTIKEFEMLERETSATMSDGTAYSICEEEA